MNFLEGLSRKEFWKILNDKYTTDEIDEFGENDLIELKIQFEQEIKEGVL